MNTTKRKLFSYDLLEDADIQELFDQLPNRQHSKYIRMALRTAMKVENGTFVTQTDRTGYQQSQNIDSNEAVASQADEQEETALTKEEPKEEFYDPTEAFLDLGK